MKLYHYALFFVLVCIGFFMTAHIELSMKMQEESNRKTEYECLVAAVDAVADVVFAGGEYSITKTDLAMAEEVFFQTLEMLWYGTVNQMSRETLEKRVPCLVVFDEAGYFQYCFEKGKGYGWSEMVPYEQGKVPAAFFTETEAILSEYHNISYTPYYKYRIEQAQKGIWEQEISPPCVFAIYAPIHSGVSEAGHGFVYAASAYRQIAFYVTEDNCCHLSHCEEYKKEKVIACYSTQKESAEAGAVPCERCLG